MKLRGDQAPGSRLRAAGKAARRQVPRSALAELKLPPGRDPLGIIAAQNRDRLSDLVPVRIGRMSVSPFTFFRGAAGPMAYDLAWQQRSGATLVACGDAHLGNFGLYASPERKLVFDLNDFDEVDVAPWEWDVHRLLTSIVLAGRDNGLSADAIKDATRQAATRYRVTLAELMELTLTERYYLTVDVDQVRTVTEGISARVDKEVQQIERRARKRTSERVVSKITTRCDEHGLQIVDDPPILIRTGDLAPGEEYVDIPALFDGYRAALRPDIGRLLDQYVVADSARRVVGVGSVGTRCGIILLLGPDDEPLVLQLKEALPSVLQTYGGMPSSAWRGSPSGAGAYGYRVISGQRVMQAQSDPFLGSVRGDDGRGYYWRQFRDMKGSVELTQLRAEGLTIYGAACASLLARAHSQSPAAAFITGYLGKSERFDDAVTTWAHAYADQTERDYEAFMGEIDAGKLPCDTSAAR